MGETPSSCYQWLNGRVPGDGGGWTAGRKLGVLRTFKWREPRRLGLQL